MEKAEERLLEQEKKVLKMKKGDNKELEASILARLSDMKKQVIGLDDFEKIKKRVGVAERIGREHERIIKRISEDNDTISQRIVGHDS